MTVEVVLYRTDDYVRAGRVRLVPLLSGIFEQALGRSLTGCRFELRFLPVADTARPAGEPEVVNLQASHGYVEVRILDGSETVYRHPHSVRELVAGPLQTLLRRRLPAETHWGFGFQGPGLDAIPLVRPAPRVAGRFSLATDPRRRRLFQVEQIPDPEPPRSSLAALGVPAEDRGWWHADPHRPDPPTRPAERGPVRVVVGRPVARALTLTMPLSDQVEEGGFLAGHVHRDADRPGGYLVQVTAAIPAERTGASLMHFTFTGESFMRIREQLRARGSDEQLVGWYHTHLFPATASFGLSSVDVELHTSTFRQPWQLAALINIGADRRVLRFYQSARTPDASPDATPRAAPGAAPTATRAGTEAVGARPTDVRRAEAEDAAGISLTTGDLRPDTLTTERVTGPRDMLPAPHWVADR